MGRRREFAGEGRQPPKIAMIEQLTSSSTFYEVEYCTVQYVFTVSSKYAGLRPR